MTRATLEKEVEEIKKRLEELEQLVKPQIKHKKTEKNLKDVKKAIEGIRKMCREVPGFDSVEYIRKLRGPI